ncbi:MAG: sulfatase, partial [Planctomycetes bacterium]|nr:sulfatase [Planctomycetota bacterium]
MTERAAHALPVAAGSLAGALIGLATLRGGPLDGAASAWALWTAFGALVGFALILLRPLLGALASWYGTRPMAVASVLLVAATVPAALELGARPWATRVPAGALVAWAVVAAVAVAAAQSLAWLFARKEGGLPVIPVLLVVVVTTALLPESALLPLPLGRWTIACGLVFAACAVLRVRWRWSAIGWPVAGGAALILLSIGPAAPLASEHLLTSTIRAPFVQAPHGPSAASLARLGQVFGRSVSGRSAELASLVPDRRLNVLWITVCTFRHDRLGKADVTPSIDDLARRARVFDNAWTPCPVSAAASEAMFSGRYASACDGWRKKHGLPPLPSQSWLPSLVKGAGYATWAYTSLGRLAQSEDFRRLFDGFDIADPAGVTENRPGVDTARAFIDQLRTRNADAPPFFAWLFIMDAHAPYDGDPERPDAEADELTRYDGEVRASDRAIGRALAALERHGVADRTMVVVHADHGEAFGEHGASWHGSSVYDEQVRVPLVVHVPGLPAGRTVAPVDLTDIEPTVLEVLDVAGASGLGDSLVPALLGDEFESYACSEMLVRDTPSAEQRMIVGPDLKKLVQYGNGASEVYRLADDPGEGRALGVEEGSELEGLLAARVHVSTAGGTATSRTIASGPLDENLPAHVRAAVTALDGGRPDLLAFQLVRSWLPDRALDAARRLVGDEQPGARVLALNQLAAHGSVTDVQLVRAALVDDDQQVRVAAAATLAALAGQEVASDLLKIDGVPVRDAVERAIILGKIGKADALRALIPQAASLPLPALERLLHGLAQVRDADTLALAEAVARTPTAPPPARWRAVGMLISGGATSVGRITRGLTRGGLPPDEMLALAMALAPK